MWSFLTLEVLSYNGHPGASASLDYDPGGLTRPLPSAILNLLPILQEYVSPGIRAYSELKIKESSTPAAVFRLALEYEGAAEGPDTLILKVVQPDYPPDPGFPDRELLFYRRLSAVLDMRLARAYYTGLVHGTQERLILLEDLVSHRLHPRTRPWTPAEGECIARTYARLHVSAARLLPPQEERGWLLPRHESRLERESIRRMVGELVRLRVWDALPGLDRLLDRTLEAAQAYTRLPSTLLHNDVYPPNIALPPDLGGEAILLDWEMASFGLAEMDLAFLFIQPFRAHRRLDKASILGAYWAARQALEGGVPGLQERDSRQFYADSVWGFWLVPVAHRMATDPAHAGPDAAVYWESMFGVLHEHLARLSQALL